MMARYRACGAGLNLGYVTDRFRRIFGEGSKPVIAMAHLGPLPGTPLYDEARGVRGIVDDVARDLDVLLQFPFDAVMFCNEGDRPYSLRAGFEGVAVMTRVVADLAPSDRPFGVDFLWDGRAALAVAAATGAAFIREVVTGAYESDMGVWAPDAGELLRYRRALDAQEVAVFMNVTPEFASTIGSRSAGQLARSAAVSSLADAILVSGPMAGVEPDPAKLREAKAAVGNLAPVLANTGAKAANVALFLEMADGVIVGSDLKAGGGTWNPVDAERVKRFLEAAGRG
jgi:membrane complex biogenesis BtpA family protein